MSYTLEFLPAAALAAEKVQNLEAALLRKRGELQSFEGEFRQARLPVLSSHAVSSKAVDGGAGATCRISAGRGYVYMAPFVA